MNWFRRKKIDSGTSSPDVARDPQTVSSVDALWQNLAATAMQTLETKIWAGTLREEALLNYDYYDTKLSDLLLQIDGCLKLTNRKARRIVDKSWKRTLETAHKKLEQYKSIVEGKKKSLKHEYKEKTKLNSKRDSGVAPLKVWISGAEIQELERRRTDRRKKIQIDIDAWQAGKFSDTAPWPNESVEQIKESKVVDKKHHKYGQKLNDQLWDAASSRIESNNQAVVREILQWIANNSLTEQQINYCLANMGQLAPVFEQHGLTDKAQNLIQTRWWRYSASVSRYKSMDSETAYRTGWVLWLLNNALMRCFPNAKPGHIWAFTNIAAATTWIYAIFKVGKRAFSKNAEWKRNIRKAGALWAAIQFVPALLTWQWGFSLIWDILSWKADFWELGYRLSNCLRCLKDWDSEVYRQVTPWILWMSIIPQNYKVADLRNMQTEFSTNPQARPSWYDSTYNRLNQNTSALATEFQNTFTHRDTYDPSEWTAFRAKVWIDNNTSDSVIVFNEVAKTAEKGAALQSRMKSEWKKKKPEFEAAIDAYLKAPGEFNLNDLSTNRFETDTEAAYTTREVDTTNKEKLEKKVDALSLNDDIKTELKEALEQFYDARTIGSKPIVDAFNLSLDSNPTPNLILESRGWEKTTIDLINRTIVWFGKGITFADLSNLINVADLSNKILEGQKWEKLKDLPPFKYKGIGGRWRWIYFNSASGRNFDLDTRVLSWGRWWTIGKIDTIKNYPDDYARYLSERWIDDNKITIDSIKYADVYKLSQEWIKFFDETEVQQLDRWLKQVKSDLSSSVPDPNTSSPFSITLLNKLSFKKVDGSSQNFDKDISTNFPTLLREWNKQKFLDYMNNPANGMRYHS